MGDRIDVLMDGGVQRGTHVLKALSVGAKAVGFREDLTRSRDVQHGHVVEDDDDHHSRLCVGFSHGLIVSQFVGKAAGTTPVE